MNTVDRMRRDIEGLAGDQVPERASAIAEAYYNTLTRENELLKAQLDNDAHLRQATEKALVIISWQRDEARQQLATAVELLQDYRTSWDGRMERAYDNPDVIAFLATIDAPKGDDDGKT